MLMSQFLQSRKTIRDYKKKAITAGTVEEIKVLLRETNEKAAAHGVELVLITDGKDIQALLADKGGYAGVMIDSPGYVAMNIREEKDEAYVYGAYYLEEVTTKLYAYNLGSCWISLGGVEASLKQNITPEAGSTEYLLSIGYPIAQMGIGEIPFSSRLGVEEVVFHENGEAVTMAELEQRGLDDLFYYIRFAPSAYNKQPWRFTLSDREITMKIKDYEDKVTLVDAGIMVYYLERMLSAIGIAKKFRVALALEGADKVIGTIEV